MSVGPSVVVSGVDCDVELGVVDCDVELGVVASVVVSGVGPSVVQWSKTPEDRGTRETLTHDLFSRIVPWTVHSSSSPFHSYTVSASEFTSYTEFPANTNIREQSPST